MSYTLKIIHKSHIPSLAGSREYTCVVRNKKTNKIAYRHRIGLDERDRIRKILNLGILIFNEEIPIDEEQYRRIKRARWLDEN